MNNEMVNFLKNGDAQGLTSLYSEFGNRLYKSALFLADSREEAEDIVQETFVRVFTYMHRFRGRSSLYTWIYQIFLNVNCDLRRKKYTHKKFLTRYIHDENIDPIDDLVRKMDQDTFSKSLNQALRRLNMKSRQIIVLRFYEEMKLSEIAEVLNITIGTVKSRLYHALKKIKKSIKNIEQFMVINDQRYGEPDELPEN